MYKNFNLKLSHDSEKDLFPVPKLGFGQFGFGTVGSSKAVLRIIWTTIGLWIGSVVLRCICLSFKLKFVVQCAA